MAGRFIPVVHVSAALPRRMPESAPTIAQAAHVFGQRDDTPTLTFSFARARVIHA